MNNNRSEKKDQTTNYNKDAFLKWLYNNSPLRFNLNF